MNLRVGAALAGFLVATTAAYAQEPKMVVKVGVLGRADQYNFEIAYRRGYFADQGLEIQTVAAGSAQEYVAALATNQIQVASGSPNAGLFNALNRGINILMVADWAHLGDGVGKGSGSDRGARRPRRSWCDQDRRRSEGPNHRRRPGPGDVSRCA